jgi:hypothetical protein
MQTGDNYKIHISKRHILTVAEKLCLCELEFPDYLNVLLTQTLVQQKGENRKVIEQLITTKI